MIPALVGASLGTGSVPSNFYSIATVTVGAGGSPSVSFSSIDQTFTHLQIRGISRESATNGYYNLLMRVNSDSGTSSYYSHTLYGVGAGTPTASAYSGSTGYAYIGFESGGNQLASDFAAHIIDVLDYTSTSKNKTFRSLSGLNTNNGTGGEIISLNSSLWINTSAISTITLYPSGGGSTFSQYTSFALYGVK